MRNIIKDTIALLIFALLIFFFFFAMTNGINNHFQNQDLMLCNSAKTSQNVEYLERCACYYDTGDINCLKNK